MGINGLAVLGALGLDHVPVSKRRDAPGKPCVDERLKLSFALCLIWVQSPDEVGGWRCDELQVMGMREFRGTSHGLYRMLLVTGRSQWPSLDVHDDVTHADRDPVSDGLAQGVEAGDADGVPDLPARELPGARVPCRDHHRCGAIEGLPYRR